MSVSSSSTIFAVACGATGALHSPQPTCPRVRFDAHDDGVDRARIDEATAQRHRVLGRELGLAGRALRAPRAAAPIGARVDRLRLDRERFDLDDLHSTSWHSASSSGPWPQGNVPNGRVAYTARAPTGVASLTSWSLPSARSARAWRRVPCVPCRRDASRRARHAQYLRAAHRRPSSPESIRDRLRVVDHGVPQPARMLRRSERIGECDSALLQLAHAGCARGNRMSVSTNPISAQPLPRAHSSPFLPQSRSKPWNSRPLSDCSVRA